MRIGKVLTKLNPLIKSCINIKLNKLKITPKIPRKFCKIKIKFRSNKNVKEIPLKQYVIFKQTSLILKSFSKMLPKSYRNKYPKYFEL